MNSRRKELDAAHRVATKEASRLECLVCGLSPCVPAHYPRHRGSGGRFENDWDREHWVPLCFRHHEVLDRRHGVSDAADFERDLVIRAIEARRERWVS